jgi:hypothetical protein
LLTGQESEALSAESSGGGLSVSGSGEFKFNWATPSTAGCRVLEIALVDGNTLLANFDLR